MDKNLTDCSTIVGGIESMEMEAHDWKEHIIDTVLRYYDGRQIVLWGKYGTTEDIKEKLKDNYGIHNVCYIESNSEMVDGKEVFDIDYIMGKRDICYVVVTLAVYAAIREKILGGGYETNIDYYYFSDCIVKCTDEYYEDAHGNRFIGKRDGIKFCFSGWNSTIRIGEGAKFDESLTLYLHNNQTFEVGVNSDIRDTSIRLSSMFGNVLIGDNCKLVNCVIHVRNKANLIIEDSVKNFEITGKSRISVLDNGNLRIGSQTTFGYRCNIACFKDAELTIGKDCMLSWGISICAGDGHAFFDVKNGKSLNKLGKKVFIGEHVWIGMNSNILNKSYIGEGSIVGAGSVVKGKYPNNCVIAGNVAEVIKTDVAWCRNDGEDNIEECGDYTKPSYIM